MVSSSREMSEQLGVEVSGHCDEMANLYLAPTCQSGDASVLQTWLRGIFIEQK